MLHNRSTSGLILGRVAALLGAVLIVGGLILAINKRANEADQPSNKIDVVTSFYPLFFFAAEIGGEKAAVTNITPAGIEPHDYEPTGRDVALIEGSQMLILNGGGLEVWAESIKDNLKSSKTNIIVAGEGLATAQMEEDGEKQTDPHVWLDPNLAVKMVDKIAEGYVRADAGNSEYYLSRATDLKKRLADLDQEYRQDLARCQSRDIVTSHAAFNYLAKAYSLDQIPIRGLSPDVEPSAQAISAVVDFARQNNVKYIFFEELVSPKLAQTIASEVGAETLVLSPLEGLPEDATAEENYFSVMRANLQNLKLALQCM
jgi:zinc transport system substrate-binding protein